MNHHEVPDHVQHFAASKQCANSSERRLALHQGRAQMQATIRQPKSTPTPPHPNIMRPQVKNEKVQQRGIETLCERTNKIQQRSSKMKLAPPPHPPHHGNTSQAQESVLVPVVKTRKWETGQMRRHGWGSRISNSIHIACLSRH